MSRSPVSHTDALGLHVPLSQAQRGHASRGDSHVPCLHSASLPTGIRAGDHTRREVAATYEHAWILHSVNAYSRPASGQVCSLTSEASEHWRWVSRICWQTIIYSTPRYIFTLVCAPEMRCPQYVGVVSDRRSAVDVGALLLGPAPSGGVVPTCFMHTVWDRSGNSGCAWENRGDA